MLILLAAGYLIFTAIHGLATGRMNVLYRFVNRGEDQTLYWLSIAISVLLGLAMIIADLV
jgi:hypothetical protein